MLRELKIVFLDFALNFEAMEFFLSLRLGFGSLASYFYTSQSFLWLSPYALLGMCIGDGVVGLADLSLDFSCKVLVKNFNSSGVNPNKVTLLCLIYSCTHC